MKPRSSGDRHSERSANLESKETKKLCSDESPMSPATRRLASTHASEETRRRRSPTKIRLVTLAETPPAAFSASRRSIGCASQSPSCNTPWSSPSSFPRALMIFRESSSRWTCGRNL